MKNVFLYLMILLSISFLTSCTPPVQHADPFYNVNDDFSMPRIPLIKPIEAERLDGSSPWGVFLPDGPSVRVPDREGIVYYDYNIEELEKFAVSNGIIMAYSVYVNKDADAYIQENYYYWFVVIPEKKISDGFHTEDQFRQYIQTLGIENLDWQTPDEAFDQFRRTGCLEWIPDCK
jgi:hypothetical protein